MGKIVGRSDDMLIIRGVNVFPTQIEELVLQQEQLGGQYQIIVTRDGHLDNVQVRCELAQAHLNADRVALAQTLQHHIKAMIGISTRVSVEDPEAIERTLTGKARRAIDKRPK